MGIKGNTILVVILLFVFVLRAYNIDWDAGQHLHPDERFMTMVTEASRLPKSLFEYLDPQRSKLNPYNINFDFYVYGTFPIVLVKIAAVFLKMDSYQSITILGRVISALLDTATGLFIFLLAHHWQKKYKLHHLIKYLALLFYGITVLAIQYGHFFVVDTFLVFFLTGSFYFAERFSAHESRKNFLLSTVFFGCALGSKINALFMLPIILYSIIRRHLHKKQRRHYIAKCLIFVIISYLVVRVVDPKLFFSPNFLNPSINPKFIASIKSLDSQYSPGTWFPPAVQWISKYNPLFAGVNIAFFGLGMPYFLLAFLGIVISFTAQSKGKMIWRAIIFWIIGFYLYQSTRFIATMRYYLLLYPFLAYFAAVGYVAILSYVKKKSFRTFLAFVVVFLVLLWPISFMNIYTRPHSRIAASQWIHANIPENSFLAQEAWDDSLPLYLSGVQNRTFKGEQIPIIGPDTKEKWDKIEEVLAKADYYITSSNRAYGSMLPLPHLFPKTSLFYKELFAGRRGFIKIKEFTSYPTFPPLCYRLPVICYMFNDQWADEAFSVFDHPKVMIFKKF